MNRKARATVATDDYWRISLGFDSEVKSAFAIVRPKPCNSYARTIAVVVCVDFCRVAIAV